MLDSIGLFYQTQINNQLWKLEGEALFLNKDDNIPQKWGGVFFLSAYWQRDFGDLWLVGLLS